ncbi:MAG: polymorphic toxin-type HINT domain-containing protein [Oscillospiraceae bacterium]
MLNWDKLGHALLDVAGMIPGVGFVFDGINGAWYAAEGDWYNAVCSFVSMLPGLGDAIGSFAKAEKSCKIITAFHKAGSIGNIGAGTYSFGKIAKKYISGDASFTWDEIKGDLYEVAMTGVSMFGSAKDFGTSYCFVAGTLVTTEDGFKPIEEIEVGDKVLSENELTGEVENKTVTKTYINQTTKLTHVGVNGEEFVCTPTHPFYVYQHGWIQAANLRAGDVLVLSNGELVVVEWVQHEILEEAVNVYNLEVQDFHTYFIGESGVWVHNQGCKDKKTYQTYTKTNPKTGEVYSGRTSGYGTPKENVAKRDKNHHMNEKGFGPAVLDKSSTNKDAIRGREQQLIDSNGRAKSQGGTSGNAIRGIGLNNKNKDRYMKSATDEFGELT